MNELKETEILLVKIMNNLRLKIHLFRRRNYKAQGDLDIKFKKYLKKRHGFYIEIGANDGVHQSNTFYLEKKKKWSGLLVEPGKNAFSSLIKNRSDTNIFINAACVPFYYEQDFIEFNDYYLMGYIEGINTDNNIDEHKKFSEEYIGNTDLKYSKYDVPAKTLNSILLENNAPKNIDFFSLDVEGEELSVLEGLDFSIFKIKYIFVESRNKKRTISYLVGKNYEMIEDFDSNYLFKLKMT